MYAHWGPVPEAAFAQAYKHYGQSVVDQALLKSLQHWQANEVEYASAGADMAIAAEYYRRLILPAAEKLLTSLAGR